MNPETNRFEQLQPTEPEGVLEARRKQRELAGELARALTGPKLLRPDGSEVPDHWPIYAVGEEVVIKGYRFRVAHIGEAHMLLEPVGPLLVGAEDAT